MANTMSFRDSLSGKKQQTQQNTDTENKLSFKDSLKGITNSNREYYEGIRDLENQYSKANADMQMHSSYVNDYLNGNDWANRGNSAVATNHVNSAIASINKALENARPGTQAYFDLMSARNQYSSILGSIDNKAEMYNSFRSQDEYDAFLKEMLYKDKYSNSSYQDVQRSIQNVDDVEERNWLQRNSQSFMNDTDFNSAIEAKQQEISSIQQQINNINSNVDMSTGRGTIDYAGKQRLQEQLRQAKADLENLQKGLYLYDKGGEYSNISDRENYAELSSQIDQNKGRTFGIGIGDTWLGTGDAKYAYINDLNNRKTNAINKRGEGSGTYDKYNFMTDEEIANYNYLYQAEGKASADDYLEYLSYSLNERRQQQVSESAAEFAGKNAGTAALASGLSVASNLISGMGAVDAARQRIFNGDRPVDYNTAAFTPSNITTSIRGQVAGDWNEFGGKIIGNSNITDEYGRIDLDKAEHPFLAQVLNGKGLGDAYQLGMSMLDSAAIAAMTGPYGKAVQFLGTSMLGGSAATQGMLDAVAKGASDDQAIAMGLLNGTFETLFEYVSLDKLLNDSTGNLVRDILTQSLTEGSEEISTSLANTIADVLVMAKNSDYRHSIQEYIDQGLSEKDATIKALEDIAIGMGWDFVGGAISGGGMGAVMSGITNLNGAGYKAAYQNSDGSINTEAVKALMEETGELNPDLGALSRAQSRMDNGKEVTGRQIMQMSKANKNAIDTADIEKVRNAAQEQLQKYGETGDVSSIADIISRQIAGKKISKAENRTISESKYGQRVLNELNPENIESGDYNSAWAKGIGTDNLNVDAYNDLLAEAEAEPINMTPEFARAISKRGILSKDAYNQIKKSPESYGFDSSAEKSSEVKSAQSASTSTASAVKAPLASNISSENESESGVNENVDDINADVDAVAQRLPNISVSVPDGRDAASYTRAYKLAYSYGQSSVPYETAKGLESVKALSAEEFRQAYTEGRAASDEKASRADAENKSGARGTSWNKGSVTYTEDYHGEQGKAGKEKRAAAKSYGVTTKDFTETFNDPQKRAYRIFSQIAEVTGVNIVLYKSNMESNEASGVFDRAESGTIYVDINAGMMKGMSPSDIANYTMLRTFTHEFVHFCEKWNPIQYNELRKAVFDYMADNGTDVDARITAMQSQNMSYDMASREVVAESLVDILPQSQFVEKLANEHKSIFQKLLDQLKQFIEDIKNAFASMNRDSYTDAVKEELNGALQYAQNLVDLFDNVAKQSVENYQASNSYVSAEDLANKVRESESSESVNIRDMVKPSRKSVSASELASKVSDNYTEENVDILDMVSEDEPKSKDEINAMEAAKSAGIDIQNMSGNQYSLTFPDGTYLSFIVDDVFTWNDVISSIAKYEKTGDKSFLKNDKYRTHSTFKDGTISSEYGYSISYNGDTRNFEVSFDEAISDDVKDLLKNNGFKWDRKNRCWSGYVTDPLALKRSLNVTMSINGRAEVTASEFEGRLRKYGTAAAGGYSFDIRSGSGYDGGYTVDIAYPSGKIEHNHEYYSRDDAISFIMDKAAEAKILTEEKPVQKKEDDRRPVTSGYLMRNAQQALVDSGENYEQVDIRTMAKTRQRVSAESLAANVSDSNNGDLVDIRNMVKKLPSDSNAKRWTVSVDKVDRSFEKYEDAKNYYSEKIKEYDGDYSRVEFFVDGDRNKKVHGYMTQEQAEQEPFISKGGTILDNTPASEFAKSHFDEAEESIRSSGKYVFKAEDGVGELTINYYRDALYRPTIGFEVSGYGKTYSGSGTLLDSLRMGYDYILNNSNSSDNSNAIDTVDRKAPAESKSKKQNKEEKKLNDLRASVKNLIETKDKDYTFYFKLERLGIGLANAEKGSEIYNIYRDGVFELLKSGPERSKYLPKSIVKDLRKAPVFTGKIGAASSVSAPMKRSLKGGKRIMPFDFTIGDSSGYGITDGHVVYTVSKSVYDEYSNGDNSVSSAGTIITKFATAFQNTGKAITRNPVPVKMGDKVAFAFELDGKFAFIDSKYVNALDVGSFYMFDDGRGIMCIAALDKNGDFAGLSLPIRAGEDTVKTVNALMDVMEEYDQMSAQESENAKDAERKIIEKENNELWDDNSSYSFPGNDQNKSRYKFEAVSVVDGQLMHMFFLSKQAANKHINNVNALRGNVTFLAELTKRGSLKEAINKAWEASEKQAAEMKESIKEEYGKSVEEIQAESEELLKRAEETTRTVESTVKLDDFGEKIGGARKDWHKTGLISSDIDDMNDREIASNLKKDNIWKKPNYKKRIEGGANRGIQFAVNEIRKALNQQFSYRFSILATEESKTAKYKEFVDTIRVVQQYCENATSKQDLRKILDWLLENDFVTTGTMGNIRGKYYSATSKYRDNPALYGSDLVNVVERLTRESTNLTKEADLKNFESDSDVVLPKNMNISFGSVRNVITGEDVESWNITINRSIIKTGFKTYEEALAYARERYGKSRSAGKKNGKSKFVPDQLKEVHRKGPDYRGSANVAGQNYMDVFGFRGGEFGNWMNANDRQTSLNYGYDALMDLSDALGIDPKSISFNGALSIAFGSRGVAGAAAHYEPDRHVINLTKMNGAGSLAHEWFHGFDDFLTGYSTDAFATDKPYKLPEATRSAVESLVNAMRRKEASKEQSDEIRRKTEERNKSMLERALYSSMPWVYEMEHGSYSPRQYYNRQPTQADVDTYRGYISEIVKTGNLSYIDKLSQLNKDVTNRGIPKEQRDSLIYRFIPFQPEARARMETIMVPTDFLLGSQQFGKSNSKDGGYWDSTIEMAARAFSCYIYDKLGGNNDYLEGHSNVFVALDEAGQVIRAYPVGAERKAINEAFDKLIEAAKEDGFLIRQGETEKPDTVQYQARNAVYEDDVQYQRREDRKEIIDYLDDQVEDGEYVTTYKAFALIEGQLFPPMASYERDESGKFIYENYEEQYVDKKGNTQTRIKSRKKLRGRDSAVSVDEIGKGKKNLPWIASEGKLSDEQIASKPHKEPLKNGQSDSPYDFYLGDFSLDKSSGKPVPAAYNPYQHSSNGMLNDQFEEGYNRPEIVIVECRIAKSEIDASKRDWSAYSGDGTMSYDYEKAKDDPTKPYFARYAKNSTGEHQWKSGPIAGQLNRFQRSVYMTRWIQPVRIVPNEEVARHIADIYSREESDTLRMYWNTINPDVLPFLDKMGVAIDPYGSPNYLSTQSKDRYGNKVPDELFDLRNAEREYKKILKSAKDAKTDATYERHMARAREYYRNTLIPAMSALNEVEEKSGVKSRPLFPTEVTDPRSRFGSDEDDAQYQARKPLSAEAETFKEDVLDWYKNGKPDGETFILGSTGDVLQGLGTIENDVYILSDKINDIFSKHPEIGIKEIQNIPEIIENPVLILSSKNLQNVHTSTRIVVYGMAKAKNNIHELVVFDLKPTESKIVLDDMQKVVSTYTKDKRESSTADFIRSSYVLYADKEKTASLLHAAGFQNAYLVERSGYMGKIAYNGATVNISGVPFDKAFYEVATQTQLRRRSLSDRDILSMAATQIKIDDLTEAERDALNIFQKRLDTLLDLETRRAELGSQFHEQQFGSGDRSAAPATREQMKNLDARINEAANKVFEAQNAQVLRRVLKEARKVVEAEAESKFNDRVKRIRDRQNNSAAIRKYRTRIQSDVKDISDWVLHPSNKNALNHVPEVLKDSVIPFISSIDFTSKRQLRGGEATKADKEFVKRLENLKKAVNSSFDRVGRYSGYMDLPPEFMDQLDKFIEESHHALDSLSDDGFIINKMSSDELEKLSKLVRWLKQYIKTVNKFHNNAMFEHISDAGSSSISHMGQIGDARKVSSAVAGVNQLLMWQQIRPAYAFERFGDGGIAIYDELRRGQATLAFNTVKIKDFADKAYTASEVKAWENSIKTFKLGEDTVKIPVSYIMGLYELSKRPQALNHILGGGIRIATYENKNDNGRKVSDQGHKLTQADLQEILSVLTPRQMEVADNPQQYMAKQGGEWGNHVSVARFGEELFGEEHYYPINSDGRHLEANNTEAPTAASLYALLNMSFTKELQEGANNRVIVYSIFDVFANHMASMAQYNAFALPVLDALKWFNYKYTEIDDSGVETERSVREEMDRVYGVPTESKPGSGHRGYAESFVMNILKAYNGTEAQGSPMDSVGMKMLHHYNMAQVAYNLRVVVQQPMAIARAGLLVDYGDIIKGLKLNPSVIKKNIAEMNKYSGIAAWKDLGFYDINISRGLTEIIKHDETWRDKVSNVGMAGAELADKVTWAAMWSACKESVKRNQRNIPYGTPMFYEAVTKLFEDVIYKTQVVDSILTKNEFLRDKGFFARTMGSFMSEPTTTASMLLDAGDKFALEMQRGKNFQQAWGKYGRLIGRTAGVYAINSLMLAIFQSFADAFRDDDDYKTYWQKWMEAFKGNLVDEAMPFNKLPIFKNFYDGLKTILSKMGVDTYGNSSNTVIGQIADYFAKATEIMSDKISGEKTNYTWYGAIYKLIQAASGLSGLPMAAATREVVTIWNNTIGAMAPSLKVKTYEASERSQIKYAYMDGYIDEEDVVEYLQTNANEDEDKANKLLDQWKFAMEHPGYDSYSETQAHNYYEYVEPAGIDLSIYAQLIEDKKDCHGVDKNNDGRADNGSVRAQVLELIDSLMLSNYQKDALYYAMGYKESTISNTPWHK